MAYRRESWRDISKSHLGLEWDHIEMLIWDYVKSTNRSQLLHAVLWNIRGCHVYSL